MKFAHFGDVHFRPLARHDEYKDAFLHFKDISKNLGIDHIVISGDIVHEKNQRLYPEIYDLLVWWFHLMADIAPLHIILGNHDLNLSNKKRQDAISPIIKAINRKDIYLYKFSGSYPIDENFIFKVFSACDEENWQNIKPSDKKINIALFHGAVNGAMTDIGYFIEGDVNPVFFDGYDFAMLGDIHRHQFLDEKSRIAYPGSTIQQNFGESINNHGFLLWDIKDKDKFNVKLIELKNNKPFVSLNWKDNIENTIKDINLYPNESRFRICNQEPLSKKDMLQIENEIFRLKKSPTFFKFDDKKYNKIANDNSQIVKRNLRDPQTLVSLLKEFYEDGYFSENEWELVYKLTSDLIINLSPEQDDIDRNTIWTPIKIEFSNFLQYGEKNIINFENLNEITGIFAPNGYGKSTILAAISYALFGKLDRDINQNHNFGIVNRRKTECECKFTFDISGKRYMIHRITEKVEKKDGRLGAKGQIYFWNVDNNGNIISALHEKSPQETDKLIRKMVGTIEDFKLTALASQKDLESFISDFKSTERKKILYRFRDINVLQELYDKAKTSLSEYKGAMKSLTLIDWNQAIEDNNIIVKNIKNENVIIENKIEILRENLSQKQKEFSEKTNKSIIITKTQFENQKIKVKRLFDDIENLKNEIDDIKVKKVILEQNLEKIIKSKSKIPIDEIKLKFEKKKTLESKIAVLKQRLDSEKNVLDSKNKIIKKLDTVPCGDQFPTCKYIVDAHKEKNNIKTQEQLIRTIIDDIQQFEILVVDDEEYKEKIIKYDDLIKKEITIIKAISSISIETMEENLENKIEKANEEDNKLKHYELNVSSDDNNVFIKNIKNDIENIGKEIKILDSKRIENASKIGSLFKENEKFLEEKNIYDGISIYYKIYDSLVFAFGKKGIPNQIIRMDLPSLNAEISNILKGAVPFDIEIDIEDESDKLEIYIISDGYKLPIELGCGSEKVIAALAIRVALLNASTFSKPDFIALDESFDGIDDNNIDTVLHMISSIKKRFRNILVISHKDNIKDIANNIIEIEIRGKDSYIRYE